MEKSQEEIIQKVMALMKNNLSEPLSIPLLAKKVGYSPSHLRLIFRKATGKGVLPHFLELRVDKAKSLLRDTKLTISEIAFDCGFNSYHRFHTAFSKTTGCSPGNFRKSQGISELSATDQRKSKTETAEFRTYEPLKGPDPDSAFKPISGHWKQQDGYLAGSVSEATTLLFNEPLPENFVLRMESRLSRKAGLPSPEMDIGLCSPDNLRTYFRYALGRIDGTLGEFRVQGIPILKNPEAVFLRDVWHKIRIELEDDTISFFLDEVEMFRHREPFPPPFSHRSHLIITASNGEIGLREMEVIDRGFLPLIKAVRQGDSLYSAGFFSSARDFYSRLLASKVSTADTMELRYKIGQCFFKEGNLTQASGWMEKVIALPQTGFWADQAKLILLELDILADRMNEFRQSLFLLFEKPYNRQNIRLIIGRTCNDFLNRGFLEKSMFLQNLLFSLEEPGSFFQAGAELYLAELLLQMRKFTESEKHFVSVIENRNMIGGHRIFLLFSFCNNLGMQGKRVQWLAVLEKLESVSGQPGFDKGRLLAYRAIYYRANGQLEEALTELSLVKTGALEIAYARILRALILCAIGETTQARRCLEEAERLDPSRFGEGRRSRYYYPLELADGNFEKAADYLLKDSEPNRRFCDGADQAIKAGILLSMAGKQEEARRVWKRISELFPQKRINYYESLALSLNAGKLEAAFEMPYPTEKRSEMFYLIGLLCESGGNHKRAQEFFKQSAAEDLLVHWPAYLAKKKILNKQQPILDAG